MRDKRTRGPDSQGPNDSRSKNDWIEDHLQPWAATPAAANDNARGDTHDAANDFADEATTLYQKSQGWPNPNGAQPLKPQVSAKPTRRPSARYRPQTQRLPHSQARAQAKDEPRFGVEGSIPRSLRPGEVERGRNYGVVLAGLLVIGLGAMWTMRGGAWSRAMVSLSAYGSSVARTRATLGSGHVVEPQHSMTLHPAPLPAAATELNAARAAAPSSTDVMEFDLADVPADNSVRARAQHAKRLRAERAARHASQSAALAKPIQPLIEKAEEDYQEPVYYRAAVNEGTLQVNSRPWSRVLVDGHFMGHTPQRALRLPAGLHRVLLVNDQLDMSKLFEVNIPAGQVVTRVEILDETAHTSR